MTYRANKWRSSAIKDGLSYLEERRLAVAYISKNYRVLYNLLLNSDFEKKRRKPNTDNLMIKAFNIQGLNDLRKATIEDELLNSEETDSPIQFLLLNETHAKTEKEINTWIQTSRLKDKYFAIADSEITPEGMKSKGTAIIYSANWHPHRAGVKRCAGTVTVATFNLSDKQITIGAVYKPSHSPENTALIDKTEKFIAHLLKEQQILRQGSKQNFFALGGDWNNELNPSMDRAYVGRTTAPRSNKTNCKFLLDATSGRYGLKLTDIWRLKNPTRIEYTHASNVAQGKSEARLDYFLTCPNTNLHTKCVEHDKSHINGMHHKGINLTLSIPITRLSSRKRKKRPRPNWDTSAPNKPHFVKASKDLEEEAITKTLATLQTNDEPFTNPTQNELDNLMSTFQTALIKQLDAHIPKKENKPFVRLFMDEQNTLDLDNKKLNTLEQSFSTNKQGEEDIRELNTKYKCNTENYPNEPEQIENMIKTIRGRMHTKYKQLTRELLFLRKEEQNPMRRTRSVISRTLWTKRSHGQCYYMFETNQELQQIQ